MAEAIQPAQTHPAQWWREQGQRTVTQLWATYRWMTWPLVIALGVRMLVFAAVDYRIWRLNPHQFGLLSVWNTKDSIWYISIASQGYNYSPVSASRVNFFPLYPLLVRLFQPVAALIDPRDAYMLSGMAISWITFAAACVLLYRLVCDRFGARTALGTILLLATFPFGYYYGATYTESLYLLLAVMAFLAIERQQWWMAGVAAMLVGAERPPGILIGVCVALAYALDWWKTRHPLRPDVLALALTPLGLFAYMLFCWVTYGNPLAYIITSRAGWGGGHLQSGAVIMAMQTLLHFGSNQIFTIYVVVFIAMLALVAPTFRLLGPVYALFVVASIVAPLLDFSMLQGLGRYESVAFPVFIIIACALQRWPVTVILQWVMSAVGLYLMYTYAVEFIRFGWT
ncbi:MAG: hypothetical protein ABI068_16985 [Ktedonobacterales bacterium]